MRFRRQADTVFFLARNMKNPLKYLGPRKPCFGNDPGGVAGRGPPYLHCPTRELRGQPQGLTRPDSRLDPHQEGFQIRRYTSASEYFGRLTEGLPVQVAATPGAGRGVYATRQLAHGELIATCSPVAAHPTLDSLNKVCYACMGDLPPPPREISKPSEFGPGGKGCAGEKKAEAMMWQHESGRPAFCSAQCERKAQEQFYAVEAAADWTHFHDLCRSGGVRFPLVVKRLACMVLAGSEAATCLRPLCYLHISGSPPPRWIQERTVLTSALIQGGISQQQLSFLTEDWYSKALAQLHLNAFRVQRVSHLDASDLLSAASSTVAGSSSSATAVYLLPSFFNHDCDPNVDATWPQSSSLLLRARRHISSGEELRISYIDASMGRDARQCHLAESYGFSCSCPRCQEGDG